jgi:hypothetical protein
MFSSRCTTKSGNQMTRNGSSRSFKFALLGRKEMDTIADGLERTRLVLSCLVTV